MRRKTLDTSDSLELLLDTISNAFGGILFLALLVGLLLQMSHRPSAPVEVDPQAEVEMIELDAALTEALAQLESLERSVALQRQSRERLVDPSTEQIAAEVRASRAEVSDLEKKIEAARKSASTTQVEIDALRRSSTELDSKLATAKTDQAEVASRLKREQLLRSQVIAPPRTRGTSKVECEVVLRYDRVYLHWNIDDGIYNQKLNLDDFVIVRREGVALVTTPNPVSGLPVTAAADFPAALRRKLAGYSSQRWFVTVIAYEDSFDKFQNLKAGLVQAGYEFRILPASQGSKFAKTSSAPAQVQ
ncbi:hypothetical protein Psta_1120 [Pirellula staleyi DSM 6068]|uniref:Uncharacterized protein n=1 Tax=Pirellula staleyi (strain ATCC 27377 / DSM 6068 / ICPB 4128) TaxID=530564 RepID=D2R8X6_PIRSD|nr:hypothetical protein [Pirellula staleyi]ADB15803.1 hypothetical protein Psta_1120 [Pirellula staleyi DSM 6068]